MKTRRYWQADGVASQGLGRHSAKANKREGRCLNKEDRFDRIVGLIYDTVNDAAHDTARADAVMLAIQAELGNPNVSSDVVDSAGGADYADGLLLRLAPHIERSGNLRSRIRQLERRQHVQQTELAHLPFGLVWVDAGLQVVTQNARAGELLKPASGICLENSRLTAWVATDLERLGQALQNALRAEDRKGILLALRRRDRAVPLLASVIPVMAPLQGSANCCDSGERFALVILQNPDEAAIGLAHLQQVYGFTAAECKLAKALLNNDTLDSYAQRTALSRSTLRSHLAHLFKKTGTCRQSELVRLLMLAQPAS